MKEEKQKLLAKVAYLYYIEDKNQAEIAEELGLTRTTISRMLTQARKSGIVQIEIADFDSELFELELYFKRKYQLKHLEVMPASAGSTKEEADEKFGALAGHCIRRLAQNNQVIGISWGSTLARAVSKVGKKYLENTLCIPLAGGPSHINARFHVNTLVYELSRNLSGKSLFINASVVQETPQLAQGIIGSKYFQELKENWDKADLAIVGVGGPLSAGESQWRDLLTKKDFEELRNQHAVGECCCRFVDQDGNIIRKNLSHRTVGISLEQLKQVPVSLGIARGKEKSRAILALLRQRYLNSLVTDQETLLQILRDDHDAYQKR